MVSHPNYLSDAQYSEIREHLAKACPPDCLDEVVGSIDSALREYAMERSIGGKRLRERIAQREDHFVAILAHSRELLRLLAIQRPWLGMYDSDWGDFEPTLEHIVKSAEVHTEGDPQPPVRRGRKPLEWRDRLIASVFHMYPPGAATKTVGSHFEETVRLLLVYLGAEVEDVHSLIIDVMKRHPQKPSPHDELNVQ